MNATLLDIYTITDKEGYTRIKLIFKNKLNSFSIIDKEFSPYFILKTKKPITILDLKKYNVIKIKPLKNNKYKIIFKTIKDLIETRQAITKEQFFDKKYEYDIPFVMRYMIDKKIRPLYNYDLKTDSLSFKEIAPDFEYNVVALDIETIKGKIVLISLYGENFKKVITYKKPETVKDYVLLVKDEKEMLLKLKEIFTNKKFDVLLTYNGDGFDLPFIYKRAKKLKVKLFIEYKPHKNKSGGTCYTKGIQHVDLYKVMLHLSKIGAINLIHYKLDDIYNYLFGKHKIDIKYDEMETYYYDTIKLEKFIEYNLVDSKATYEIGENFLMQYIKLSQIVAKTLQETTRASSSTLVESKLIWESAKRDRIIPNIPKGQEVMMRETNSYEGGYVKSPEIGLHKNIAVLDFRSFHPSIIISFNISPETLNKDKCKKEIISPCGDRFCQDEKATIPDVLEEILNTRIKLKERLKNIEKNTLEYKKLYAEQWSLKILLNSTYGYLAYARARWYCFECARSILKFTHKYIKYVFAEAETFGLNTIYSDTDSAFVVYKSKEDVYKFLEYINKKLPGVLYLSLDGFYKSGLFVSKKQGNSSAKKRYALIDEKNTLKITGFESVRRDWSELAKKMQRTVLKIILETGNISKAKEVIKKTIQDINKNNVDLKDLVIISRLRKPLDSYDSIGPHISAALKALKRGKDIKVGDNIEYIITNNGRSISDKAELFGFAKDYDKEYYIHNQILPAVKSILEVFGYDEEELMNKPSQKKLW